MLLPQPSKDGPPNVVVEGTKDVLRPPRVAIEVAPSVQHWVQPLQSSRKRGLHRRAPEQVLNTLAQSVTALFRYHGRAYHPPVDGVTSDADVVTEESDGRRHGCDE